MRYRNCFIFMGEGFKYGSFGTANGVFTDIGTSPSSDGDGLQGAYVIPGLIDIHTHGNSGADFSDGDYEGLKEMASYLLKTG